MNEILKELFIGDNKLVSTDGVQVGNLLKFNHRLELLDLRNNHLQVHITFHRVLSLWLIYTGLVTSNGVRVNIVSSNFRENSNCECLLLIQCRLI